MGRGSPGRCRLGHEPFVVENRLDFSLTTDIEGQFPVVAGHILDAVTLVRAVTEDKVQRIVHMAALMPGRARQDPSRGFQVSVRYSIELNDITMLLGSA